MRIGIEAMNAYLGQTALNIRYLFTQRGLDASRFDNLMMENKSIGLSCEDSVTNAVMLPSPTKQFSGKVLLVFKRAKFYHREYEWS